MTISSLKNQKHFDQVNRRSRKIFSSYFTLVVAKEHTSVFENSTPEIIFGMKVSSKLGNAVIRNKIRRRIRHLIRLIYRDLLSPIKLKLIFIPKKGFERLDFALIYNSFRKSLIN